MDKLLEGGGANAAPGEGYGEAPTGISFNTRLLAPQQQGRARGSATGKEVCTANDCTCAKTDSDELNAKRPCSMNE